MDASETTLQHLGTHSAKVLSCLRYNSDSIHKSVDSIIKRSLALQLEYVGEELDNGLIDTKNISIVKIENPEDLKQL